MSPNTRLEIVPPDAGPLGLRTYPASKYPRKWQPLSIPLGWDGHGLVIGTLHVPTPMTEREWEALERALPVLKAGLVPGTPLPLTGRTAEPTEQDAGIAAPKGDSAAPPSEPSR